LYRLGLARAESSLAAATGDAGAFASADKSWRAAIALDRYDWQLINEHALSLNDWANAAGDDVARHDAVVELEKVVAIKPDYRSAWVNLARLAHALGDEATAGRAARQALDLDLTGPAADELRVLAG
jgi:Tfp pilus assembly protein PilF